jgi:hypothetical protein
MSERSSYVAGTPSWVDETVPDLEAAKAFYSGLFGWECETGPEEFGFYTLCRKGGRNVAGLMPEMPDSSAPPMWNTYLATDDADATAAAAKAGGATVVAEPMDVGEQGRMFFALDPTGAGIGFWQARQHTGAQRVNEPGALSWNELLTRDTAAAETFYRSLFPYEFEPMGDGEGGFDYSVLKLGDSMVGGRMPMPEMVPAEVPSYWLPYFGVEDTDASLAWAVEHGASVQRPAADSPYGRMAVLSDPFGASFAIISMAAEGGQSS